MTAAIPQVPPRLVKTESVPTAKPYAVATTAENGEDGPNYLAVLIANKLTAKPQVGVDYRGQNMVKFVQDEKYSTKSGDFLRFFAYLCHAIDDFACLDLQH